MIRANSNLDWSLVIILLACSIGACGVTVGQSSIVDLMKNYKQFDMDGDGTNEINELVLLDLNQVRPEKLDRDSKLVLVLVEDRLLEPIVGSKIGVEQLSERLQQFKTDLAAEGLDSRFIKCDIYDGAEHQDGITLLAIRQFLKAVYNVADLQGVILVGSFPESMIVRRWVWRRERWNVTIAGTAYTGKNHKPFLRIVPELVAPRADIVLADLDGNWDKLYVKRPRQLESIEALPIDEIAEWPIDGMVFESTKFNDKKIEFEDFFFVKDDDFQRLESQTGRLKLKISTHQRNPEVSTADRDRPNPIAFPEILVSRINPRHVAVIPDMEFRDVHGRHLLDPSGKPQVIETEQRIRPAQMLERDPAFERKLLVEYFDRNHAFRTNQSGQSHRTASVSYGKGLISASRLNGYLNHASSTFDKPVSFSNGSLVDVVEFAKTPARLKGVSAHSSPWNSQFGKDYQVEALEKSVGGNPWRWREEKIGNVYRYTPSLAQQNGTADAYLYRTIYENDLLAETSGSLFIHNGCEVNTPGNAARVPYNHKSYGTQNGFQNAESILFFLNGVALASRSKVFYDTPRGFAEQLAKEESNRFGDGWRAYFQLETDDAKLAKSVASNKRTYPWSIIGDWTLRVNW